MAEQVLASTGSPARIAGVHVDVITQVDRERGYLRSTTTLETGAPLTIHRKRKAETMSIQVVASDKEPIVGAVLTPFWELDHAAQVEARLQEAMASEEEITVWDGRRFLSTPQGNTVWVIDDISDSHTAPETGVYRATLSIGESRRANTSFTSAIPNVDESLSDVTGEPADRGRQSTTTVSDGDAANIAAGSWPSA